MCILYFHHKCLLVVSCFALVACAGQQEETSTATQESQTNTIQARATQSEGSTDTANMTGTPSAEEESFADDTVETEAVLEQSSTPEQNSFTALDEPVNFTSREGVCQSVSIPGYWNNVAGRTQIDCVGGECTSVFVKAKFASCQEGEFVFQSAQKKSTPENIFLRETGDTCVDVNHVWEASSFTAYSNAGGLNNIRVCPEGTTCNNGACVGETVSCREFFPGENDPTIRRINLVFVGSDYHLINSQNIQQGMDAFFWDVEAILGENSNTGLFDLAPFQNLQDKFNIWYVDHFAEMEPVVQPYDFAAHQQRNVRGRENAQLLLNECIREQDLNSAYTYLVHLVPNKGTLDSAITLSTFRDVQLLQPEAFQSCQQIVRRAVNLMPDFDRDACLSKDDYPDWQLVSTQSLASFDYNSALDYDGDGRANGNGDKLLFTQLIKVAAAKDLCRTAPDFEDALANICASGINNLGRTLFHGATMAHELGHTLGMFDISAQRPVATQDPALDQLTIANCFIADSAQTCREHAPWKGLLGNGCGESGVEDCSPADLYYSTEVTCVEGCLPGVKSYRSTRGGTYAYGTALTGTDIYYHPYDQPLGEWDARYLQQLIESVF